MVLYLAQFPTGGCSMPSRSTPPVSWVTTLNKSSTALMSDRTVTSLLDCPTIRGRHWLTSTVLASPAGRSSCFVPGSFRSALAYRHCSNTLLVTSYLFGTSQDFSVTTIPLDLRHCF